MVWQDFCFACSLYPSDKPFLDIVKQEIQYQTERLFNHPSIVVYAGNNENEEAFSSWNEITKENKDRLLIDYYKLYYETIYEVFQKEDNTRPFWPSSPSNGLHKWGIAGDPSQGDVYYWGVWHGNKPFSEYLKIIPRFCSEFGFQSMPSFNVIAPFLNEEEDFNLTSPGFEYRQRSPAVGNRAILEHITREFRIPHGFKEMIYVSQLSQGLAIKTASEHWRRTIQCDGVLYWQLNDIWPGLSWSSLDYGGKWKILHYFAKDFFSPVLVSPFLMEDMIEVFIVNDTLKELNNELIIQLHSWESNSIIKEWKILIKSNPQSRVSFWKMNINDILKEYESLNETNCFLTTNFQDSKNFLFFCSLKKISFKKNDFKMKNLEIQENQVKFDLSSGVYSPFVYIETKGNVNVNGFHLFGNTVNVVIDNISNEKDFKIISLRDTYQ
jgi:beta-mannosidase